MQSRSAAKLSLRGVNVAEPWLTRGTMSSLAEEASEAYKDVSEVVEVTDKAGISRKIVRTVPLGVVKG